MWVYIVGSVVAVLLAATEFALSVRRHHAKKARHAPDRKTIAVR